MGILDGLNPEQEAAVLHDTGPQLVIAGAGTGKTQVITRRIAYLIDQHRAKPNQILALTFTEKAAREMEERLYDLIGWESFQVPVMTFHAFGAELLGRFASHIGRSVGGGLINDMQKALLLRQHLGRIELKYYGPQTDLFEFLEGVVDYIGQLQNAGVSPEACTEYVARLAANPADKHPLEIEEQADLARIYQLYAEVKKETGTYDYNDQLQLPLDILRTKPNLAQRLAQEFKYVLVDEYQDTNAVQDELLRTFIGKTGNIFAVGDDDQAIYGFRGADIGNILSFSEHYELDKPVVLVRNYRSGQAVLDAAYRLIQHNNPERLEDKFGLSKKLVATHDDSRVGFGPYANAADEQEGVLAEIERRVGGGEPAGSIAVLAATHAPLKALAKAMARRKVPFAISTTVSIFEQPELLGLWYLLQWVDWKASDEAIAHVVMGPFVGWSASEYREILERSREELISFEEAMAKSDLERCRRLVGQLEEWRAWAKTLPVSQMAFKLVFDTGVAERWQKLAEGASGGRMVRVFEDLHRLLTQMQDFETVAVAGNLAGYLEAFPKPPALEVSEPVGEAEGVQLLTVHAAKGLEFVTVYLVGCTQRNWSAGRSQRREVPTDLKTTPELPPDHEFRRLMYVAVTRAKTTLVISAPLATVAGTRQLLSPFVKELLGDEFKMEVGPVSHDESEKRRTLMNKLQRFYPIEAAAAADDRLPFESEDGWIELSVTALYAYNFCPFEFFLEHVLKVSQPMGPQLAFGSVMHRAFERYYKSRMDGAAASLKELGALLDEAWSNRGYSDAARAESDRKLANKTLARFFDREEAAGRNVTGSEVPIRFELPEAKLRIRGKIDAVIDRSSGYEIRDFKTGRTKTSPEKLQRATKDNFQLRTYALAGQILRGAAPAAVVLDYVVTGLEGEAHLSGTILRNHRDKLSSMAQSIRLREFAPNPSSMHVCAATKYYGTGEIDELSERLLAAGEVVGGSNG